MNDTRYADKQYYRVQIDAPIERVWAELINTQSPRPFFWDGTWDANAMQPGEAYRITANKGKAVAVIGRITELEPPHKLVTTFRLTSLDDPASKVTYLLKEKDGGTEFSLVTERVIAGSKSEKSMDQGSRFIVDNFKAYVETGKVKFGARITLGLFALMAPMMPKAMRIENWPMDKAE